MRRKIKDGELRKIKDVFLRKIEEGVWRQILQDRISGVEEDTEKKGCGG